MHDTYMYVNYLKKRPDGVQMRNLDFPRKADDIDDW